MPTHAKNKPELQSRSPNLKTSLHTTQQTRVSLDFITSYILKHLFLSRKLTNPLSIPHEVNLYCLSRLQHSMFIIVCLYSTAHDVPNFTLTTLLKNSQGIYGEPVNMKPFTVFLSRKLTNPLSIPREVNSYCLSRLQHPVFIKIGLYSAPHDVPNFTLATLLNRSQGIQ